ncbi:hypothetical protein E2C01_077062 [Portunus trituberculatus]|uniref:Uncharacterized protein n=1 Tax=Portunus trituberculatus TaxID=210409 RepID=A0A5B7IJ95_PORTR|nr:hypothetical protein [Portunus trituberculatus]
MGNSSSFLAANTALPIALTSPSSLILPSPGDSQAIIGQYPRVMRSNISWQGSSKWLKGGGSAGG